MKKILSRGLQSSKYSMLKHSLSASKALERLFVNIIKTTSHFDAGLMLPLNFIDVALRRHTSG